METKHTPGPWAVDPCSVGNLHIVYRQPTESGNAMGVTVHTKPFENDEPSPADIADARLMAAAPELLEACKAYEEYGSCITVNRMISAAIVKATGETP